jgi:hypothetical protein
MRTYISSIIGFVALLLVSSFLFAADLNELYLSDYDSFWKQWRETKEKAMSCTDPDATAKFLSNATKTLQNAEVTEANAQSIEKLALEKPLCLLDSIEKLRAEEQNQIVRFFIVSPVFHDAEEIRKTLERHWNKYRIIRELYYKLKDS